MSRQIIATLLRSQGPGTSKKAIWTRHYSWMDTAMPRAVQVLMREGQPGDLIEFATERLQLGVMELVKVRAGYSVQMEWNQLVKSSPGLMKLMTMRY